MREIEYAESCCLEGEEQGVELCAACLQVESAKEEQDIAYGEMYARHAGES